MQRIQCKREVLAALTVCCVAMAGAAHADNRSTTATQAEKRPTLFCEKTGLCEKAVLLESRTDTGLDPQRSVIGLLKEIFFTSFLGEPRRN